MYFMPFTNPHHATRSDNYCDPGGWTWLSHLHVEPLRRSYFVPFWADSDYYRDIDRIRIDWTRIDWTHTGLRAGTKLTAYVRHF
jgi:hypothetical protein